MNNVLVFSTSSTQIKDKAREAKRLPCLFDLDELYQLVCVLRYTDSKTSTLMALVALILRQDRAIANPVKSLLVKL